MDCTLRQIIKIMDHEKTIPHKHKNRLDIKMKGAEVVKNVSDAKEWIRQ